MMDMDCRSLCLLISICLLGAGISGCITDDSSDQFYSHVSNNVDFYAETVSYGDGMVFRYVPDSDTNSTYIVSYTITKNGDILESVDGKKLEGISSQDPIEFKVPRDRSLDYRVDMLIMDEYGKSVHNDSIPISSLSKNEVELEFSRISKGSYGGQEERGFYVINSSSQWERFWTSTDLSYDPSPLDMDFTRNMIVVAFQGTKPTGGYGIEIKRMVDDGACLHIFVKESSPGPNCVVTQALTQPYDIVTIPKIDRSIEFHVNMEAVES